VTQSVAAAWRAAVQPVADRVRRRNV